MVEDIGVEPIFIAYQATAHTSRLILNNSTGYTLVSFQEKGLCAVGSLKLVRVLPSYLEWQVLFYMNQTNWITFFSICWNSVPEYWCSHPESNWVLMLTRQLHRHQCFRSVIRGYGFGGSPSNPFNGIHRCGFLPCCLDLAVPPGIEPGSLA